MKLLWSSNAPWAATGYGDQTSLIVSRLEKAGHVPAIHAFWGLEGGYIHAGKIPVYPKGLMAYGQDVVAAHAAHFGAKYVFTLVDAWIYNNTPFFEMMNHFKLRWIPYFPIDAEPVPVAVRVAVEQAHRRIVFTRFAAKQMDALNLEYTIIPHCIDTKVLQPVDGGREAMRSKGVNIPNDAFLVGMVAANKGNPSRKAFTQNIEAFANLKRKHRDAVLYLHTSKGEHGEYQGVNLPEYCAHLGLKLDVDVFFPNDYNYFMGFGKDYLAQLYSAMDVHLLASTGEGFGIPIIEAQSCGTPVIVGDWTAMSELCFGGWKIPKSESEKVWVPVAANQFVPRVGAITDALDLAYNNKDNPQIKTKARIGVLPFDVDTVIERYWLPYLEKLEKEEEEADKEIKQARSLRKKVSVG